jgi:hypothetical protein
MRRIPVLVYLFILLLTTGIYAKKTVPLDGLAKPDSLTVDRDHLYITDRAEVLIYSLEDFSLKKKFGRAGEGPSEFKILPFDRINLRIVLTETTILVNSMSKISIFTKKGEFVNEKVNRVPIQYFKPLGDRYAGMQRSSKDGLMLVSVNLFNAQTLEIEKVLFTKDYAVQTVKPYDPTYFIMFMKGKFRRAPLYHSYKNKLYVEGNNDEILVFDQSGNKLHTIRHDYPKIKVTEEFKQNIFAYINKRFATPAIKQRLIQRSEFNEYHPLRWFLVADDKIYALTFKHIGGKSEWVVLDLNGKFLENIMVPFLESEFLCAYPYTIGGGLFYQLNENPDTEEWELVVTKLH